MKRKRRISLILAAGILLLATGLIGLQSVPDLAQYAFMPAEEKTGETLARFNSLCAALSESFPRITLHGIKTGVTLSAGDLSRNDISLYLTGPGWNDVYPRRFLSGRPIAGADAEAGAKVIVLDEDTAFQFFGEEDAVGKTVMLGDQKLEVVGVAEHRRQIGEVSVSAAWAPLGTAAGCEMMTLTAVDTSGSRMTSVFQNAAAEAFGTGTLISLYKEKTSAAMMLRWVALILAVWLMKKGLTLLGRLWHRQTERVREESEKRYAGRMILFAVWQLAPAALLTAAAVGAGYLLAVTAIRPAYVFPEWIPESIGDFSKWVSRFWDLTAAAANPVSLQTPELAGIRFWGGLIRWGTVLTLAGALKVICGGTSRFSDPE